jgi:4-amino-4-deoxy-L-arabinose transferase-like glycosyltransferase
MAFQEKIQKLGVPNIFFGIFLVVYLFFAVSHLGQFLTADENKWLYERIPNYWTAIADQKWKKTFINDKPGVSVAIVSSPGYLLYPDSREHCVDGEDRIIRCNTEESESFLIAYRLPLVLINGLLLLGLFLVISRLVNPWVGLWSALLIGLSPPLVGITQIVNPDALLWSFASLATFTFFLTLKTQKKKLAFLSGFLLGMALLSKYVALILIPFYFGVLVLYYLFSDAQKSEASTTLKSHLGALGITIMAALVTVCVLLPAFLFYPESYFKKYVESIAHTGAFALIALVPIIFVLLDTFVFKNKTLEILRKIGVSSRRYFLWLPILLFITLIATIATRLLFPGLEIFTTLPFDAKEISTAWKVYFIELNYWKILLLEWSPLAFSLTPVVLLGLGLLSWRALKREWPSEGLWIVTLSLFAFGYIGVLIATDVLTTIRYSIILYPFMGFLAAMGFWYFSERINHAYKYIVLTLFIFVLSLLSLYLSKPFYLNYTSNLLPKTSILTDAWGYGGYEAAEYLNSLPDAENITVWADYYGVCEFFVGKCLTAYTFDGTTIKPDYFVLTRRGNIRYGSRFMRWEEKSGLTAYKYYSDTNPAWQLEIGGHPGNYVRVIKVAK